MSASGRNSIQEHSASDALDSPYGLFSLVVLFFSFSIGPDSWPSVFLTLLIDVPCSDQLGVFWRDMNFVGRMREASSPVFCIRKGDLTAFEIDPDRLFKKSSRRVRFFTGGSGRQQSVKSGQVRLSQKL